MTRKTAAITAAVSAVIAVIAVTLALFAGAPGGGDTPPRTESTDALPQAAPPTAQDESPALAPRTEQEGSPRPVPPTGQERGPQAQSEDQILLNVPAAIGANPDNCDPAADADLMCVLPPQENSPQAGLNLRVWLVEDASDAAVRNQLCQGMPDPNCDLKNLPNGIDGSYVSEPSSDQVSEIRWAYEGRPVVLAVTSQEPRQMLLSWWQNLDLAPRA